MATRFWVLSNEDSKAPFFRQRHTLANGGVWSYSPKSGWTWSAETVKEEVKPATPEENVAKKKKSLFKKQNKETDDN
jgi:hypothetical protein